MEEIGQVIWSGKIPTTYNRHLAKTDASIDLMYASFYRSSNPFFKNHPLLKSSFPSFVKCNKFNTTPLIIIDKNLGLFIFNYNNKINIFFNTCNNNKIDSLLSSSKLVVYHVSHCEEKFIINYDVILLPTL